MYITNIAFEKIKAFEGCKLQAYEDAAGVWTIGYGHTYGVRPGDKISQQYADMLLQEDTEDRSSEYRRQEDIRAYIEQNYMNDISVADIASYLGYSEAYFCRRFKQYFGHSFVSFLTDYRIRKAEELILVSRLSIKEVGKAVGYPDPNYFTKVFRRARGVSPTEYRESILAGE